MDYKEQMASAKKGKMYMEAEKKRGSMKNWSSAKLENFIEKGGYVPLAIAKAKVSPVYYKKAVKKASMYDPVAEEKGKKDDLKSTRSKVKKIQKKKGWGKLNGWLKSKGATKKGSMGY